MQTHISKWGNSLGVRLPNHILKQLHLHAGSTVNIELEGDRLVMSAPKYSLDDMLEQINADNLHSVLLDDDQIGKEEW